MEEADEGGVEGRVNRAMMKLIDSRGDGSLSFWKIWPMESEQ